MPPDTVYSAPRVLSMLARRSLGTYTCNILSLHQANFFFPIAILCLNRGLIVGGESEIVVKTA